MAASLEAAVLHDARRRWLVVAGDVDVDGISVPLIAFLVEEFNMKILLFFHSRFSGALR